MKTSSQTYISNFFAVFLVCFLLLACVFYNYHQYNYIDEVLVVIYTFMGIIFLRKINREIIIFFVIVFFYFIYSLYRKINVSSAIFIDLLQQLKPFLAFYITYLLSSKISLYQYRKIKKLPILISLLSIYIIATGQINSFYGHPAVIGNLAFISFLLYYIYSNNKNLKSLFIAFVILSVGLLSGRSKFYGIYGILIFLFVFIKKPITFSVKNIIGICIAAIIAILVSWEKFNSYFVQGINSDGIARSILYRNSINVLNDYFPFGSGLGTYANYASGVYYSPLYAKYGIDNVYGMTPTFYNFIADTFYPQLAQFGYIGIFLFIWFWRRRMQELNMNFINTNNIKNYRVGVSIIVCVLIESIASPFFQTGMGFIPMLILGYICGQNANTFSIK